MSQNEDHQSAEVDSKFRLNDHSSRGLIVYQHNPVISEHFLENENLSRISKLAALNMIVLSDLKKEGNRFAVYHNKDDVQDLARFLKTDQKMPESRVKTIIDALHKQLEKGPALVAEVISPKFEAEITNRLSKVSQEFSLGNIQVHPYSLTQQAAKELADKCLDPVMAKNLRENQTFHPDMLISYAAGSNAASKYFLSDNAVNRVDIELRTNPNAAGSLYQSLLKDPTIDTPRKAVSELLKTLVGENTVQIQSSKPIILADVVRDLKNDESILQLQMNLARDWILNAQNVHTSALDLRHIGENIAPINKVFNDMAAKHDLSKGSLDKNELNRRVMNELSKNAPQQSLQAENKSKLTM